MVIVVDNPYLGRIQELLRKNELNSIEQDELSDLQVKSKNLLQERLELLKTKRDGLIAPVQNKMEGKKINYSKTYKELIEAYRETIILAKEFSNLKKTMRVKKNGF